VPFATAPSIRDETALTLIVDFSSAGPDDTVLDVALQTRRDGDTIRFGYPVAVLAARRP
jgi:hypothetical protein